MNRSVLETGGDILLVSQFTLHASTKKGNRPSYVKAGKPDTAIPLYEKMIAQLEKDLGKPVLHRGVRRGYAGGPAERRPRHHHYRYEEPRSRFIFIKITA